MALDPQARKKVVDALNVGRALELGSILQYMGHHYEAQGMNSPEAARIFKKSAMDEMKHAEEFAERIAYLGGVPVYKPTPIKRGGELASMIKDDLDRENEAIEIYTQHVKLFDELGDVTSRRMMEKILAVEEGHADEWETLLGVQKKLG